MKEFSYKKVPEGSYLLGDVFEGLEGVPELLEVFGARISELGHTRLVVTNESPWGRLEYAFVTNAGIMHFGKDYLHEGDSRQILLDVVHELVHVRQAWDKRDLYDSRYEYVDRPTEIEAYLAAVKLAERIGYSKKQVEEYLEVPWASKGDALRLIENIERLRRGK